jgi:hypothetical protein
MESKQDLAARLVQREVFQCVSSLVSGLAQIASEVNYRNFNDAFGIDQDDLYSLCQRPNYEEAARQFIMDDADLDDLESIADEVGYWSDVLEEAAPGVHEVDHDYWCYTGCLDTFSDEDDAQEAAIESALPLIREKVWAITTTQDEFQKIVQDHNLDYDYDEVYEHWAVTSWLKKKLAERGEVVGDLAGFDIWGRCCTGQSMTLDSVIQDIAWELWGEE